MTREQRDGLSRLECKIAREQTGQPQAQTRAAFDERFKQQLLDLKDIEARFIGAVEEDAKSCHLLSVQKSHLKASNQPINVIKVRSSTTVNGRALQLWHVTYARPGSEAVAIDKSLAHARRVIEGLHAVNP